MRTPMTTLTAMLAAALVAFVTMPTVFAKIKVKVHHEKTYDFKAVRSYAWHPSGAGDVKILHAGGDDPQQIQANLDPVIRQAVEQGLAARGLKLAAADEADLYVNYYLLIGAGNSSQYMGQFVGNAPEWGLPPFSGSTTSLEIYEQGSLVLDIASRTQKSVVWRGIAQTEVDRQLSDAKRKERVQGALREMLQKFPAGK